MSLPTPEAPSVPRLEIGCYRLYFSPPSAVPAERFTGSAWRGVFGFALRRLACTVRNQPCPSCLLYYTCVYSYIFETPPPPGSEKLRKYTAAPHPFVLIPAAESSAQDYLLGLNLFGRANSMLAYVVQALREAAGRGLHPLNQPLELTAVHQQVRLGHGGWDPILDDGGRLTPHAASVPPCPPAPPRARLVLLTPLRLRIEETYIRPASFHFAHLFSSLLRRFSLLTYFHSSEPLQTDFADLTARAQSIAIHRPDLRWHEWARYSSRQRALLPMGGLLGSFELEASRLGPLWPFLWLGQFVHAGKGAAMGLGRYVILPG